MSSSSSSSHRPAAAPPQPLSADDIITPNKQASGDHNHDGNNNAVLLFSSSAAATPLSPPLSIEPINTSARRNRTNNNDDDEWEDNLYVQSLREEHEMEHRKKNNRHAPHLHSVVIHAHQHHHDEDETAKNQIVDTSKFAYLYASYFFAAWGDRMWEFAAIIFLMVLFPTSLLPSSVFGFCETFAGIIFGGAVGRYVDSNDRLKVVRVSIIGQNVVIFFAAIVFVIAIPIASARYEQQEQQAEEDSNKNKTIYTTENIATLVIIVLSGMVAKVASSLNKISIHKDWSVVLACGDSTAQSIINSNMRRVDLTCSILAPLAVGLISSAYSPSAACAFIGVWSFVSIFVELHLSAKVYAAMPSLQSPKKKPPQSPNKNSSSSPSFEAANKKQEEEEEGNVFLAYVAHPVFPISLPYCLLYCSVLSFGSVMIAFLRTVGCSDALLAAGRAMAALVAIGSTFAVPSMIECCGLVTAGTVLLWVQIGVLAPLAYVFLDRLTTNNNNSAAASDTNNNNYMVGPTMFIVVIFVSVCLSRFGLWGFDLVQTQLMQEGVDLAYAGRVNGGQDILINVCYVISYAQTMIWDDPNTFAAPALISFGTIFLAGIFFTMYARNAVEAARVAKEKAKADEEEK